MRFLRYLLVIQGCLPLFFIASLLGFYFHVEYLIGRTPTYNNPDPSHTPISALYEDFIDVSIATWALSFLAWLPLIITYLIFNRNNFSLQLIAFSFSGNMLALLLFFSDVMEWFID